MRVRIRVMALAVSLLGTVLLSGCEPSGTRGSEQQRRDDLVPLVRPLPLVKMAEPMVIEFDVPLRPKHASPALFLGFRVTDQSGLRSYEVRDAIRRAQFSTFVKLQSIAAGRPTDIPLYRIEWVGSDPSKPTTAVVGIDGIVPRLEPGEVDHGSVNAAGLDGDGSSYRYFEFAWAADISPGRYRLRLQLLDPPTDLTGFQAELMVAYARMGK
ncbi:hypothetical protein [Stenotrophomonas oahuensis]|uniref:DUF5625 domain-containing protein n=1 Tax=Stenotrophomonas oahuensis TaxID=3003271 RepID=A0ABY9YTJ3_9GAMM|nr:hypothetical protein [Stenotrophomonas sp. A5586]WNH54022.1 hypothetical protein PDM29_07015 [Stenotrophomonas sp. A5586]